MSLTKPKILFFIDGPVASAENLIAASTLNATVVFRNAQVVSSDDTLLEKCDGVYGEVPTSYADAYPAAEDAIEKYEAAIAELAKSVGDEPAPKRTKRGSTKKDEGSEQNEPSSDNIPDWKPSAD